MNITLVGYGRMGKEIEKIALNRGHNVVYRIDSMEGVGDCQSLDMSILEESDSVIEFALPIDMDKNIEFYAKSKVPVVMGTTGWAEKLESYKKEILTAGGTFVYGSNFSVGAHILFKLVESASSMIDNLADYDIMVNEFHHKNKKDSPSGTALTIAEKILENCSRKTVIQTEQLNRAIEPQELHVAAMRGGAIPGIHSVIIDSDADTVEISHTARSRAGFALGSVLAAEWLVQQKAGFYCVEDFIDSLFQSSAK